MPEFKLSDQQYELVSALWQLGTGSARDVADARSDLSLAYTTIATILARLEKKGVLTSKMKGRERHYSPIVSQKDVQRSMVGSMINTLFRGDRSALLAHLVREGDIDQDALDEVEALLQSNRASASADASKGEQ